MGSRGRRRRTFPDPPQQLAGKILKAVTGKQNHATAAAVAELLGDFVRAETGASTGRIYRTLGTTMLQRLHQLLPTPTEDQAAYLTPLVELGSRPGGVSVASLNYDLVVETAAVAADVPLSCGLDGWQTAGRLGFPDDSIRLIKLHGSLNWTRTPNRPFRIVPDDSPPPTGLPEHEFLALDYPQVVARDPFLVFGRREKLRADGPFLDLRADFTRRLSTTRCLIVIGYSFADNHVNQLITRWINGDQARFLVVVDPYFDPFARRLNAGTFRGDLIDGLWRQDGFVPPAPDGTTRRAALTHSRLLVDRRSAKTALPDLCGLPVDELADLCLTYPFEA